MKTRRDVIEFCLTFPESYEDYPFELRFEGEPITVMRHKKNKKSFAFLMRHGDDLYLNLKCDPHEAAFLREFYRGVLPGWHMNKTHWNTIVVGSDVPDNAVRRMIETSYELTKPRRSSHLHSE